MAHPYDEAFRLLVPATAGAAAAFVLDGRPWQLTAPARVPAPDAAPPYACVSYAWGAATVPHLLDPTRTMSARALPAIEATLAAVQPTALWVDALCVPAAGAVRSACLRSLGAIYGAASEVVAVLSPPCAPALARLAAGERSPDLLDALERDDWVARAWTYQELANSRRMRFVAEGAGGTGVEASTLLNALGHTLDDVRRAGGTDAFAVRTRWPRLDALQDLLADWMMGGYLERPAFQVLSAMSGRDAGRDDDRYDAMVGAIVAAPSHDGDASLPAAEAFLRACEAKGDWSLVYAVAPRRSEPGRGWRPAGAPLRALLMWHGWGDGQPWQLHATHLALEGLADMAQGTLGAPARRFIAHWLRCDEAFALDDAAAACLRRLRDAGFTGDGSAIECVGGLFFPHAAVPGAGVAVATGLRWAHGAPGLLLRPGAPRRWAGVGVFIGPVPETGTTVDVA